VRLKPPRRDSAAVSEADSERANVLTEIRKMTVLSQAYRVITEISPETGATWAETDPAELLPK
jgi:hypothetical protein